MSKPIRSISRYLLVSMVALAALEASAAEISDRTIKLGYGVQPGRILAATVMSPA